MSKLDGKDLGIYAPPNKYGYKIAINHPKIRPLYERFKRHKKALILSDRERLEFETIIFNMISKQPFKGEETNAEDTSQRKSDGD